MKVKSLRAIRIASLTGHVINVPANTPYEIPDVIAEEAFARGCVPCDGEGNIDVDTSEEELAAEAAAQENLRRSSQEDAETETETETEAETEAEAEAEAETETEDSVDENEFQDRCFAAFKKLVEEGDEAKFNKNTKAPKVGAVSEILGEKVSAEAVDAAWGEFIKE